MDYAHDPANVRRSVMEVALNYLAVGIDPTKSKICPQSHLPALAELSMLYLNFVTVARLERNPTIKDEIRARGFGRSVPAGFLCYPAVQAAISRRSKPLPCLSGQIRRLLSSKRTRLCAASMLLPGRQSFQRRRPRCPNPAEIPFPSWPRPMPFLRRSGRCLPIRDTCASRIFARSTVTLS